MDYKLYDWTESGSWTSVATAMLVNGNYVLTYSLVAGKDYTYEIGSGLGTVYDLVPYKFVIEYDVDVGGCRNIAFMVDYYNKKIQYPCP